MADLLICDKCGIEIKKRSNKCKIILRWISASGNPYAYAETTYDLCERCADGVNYHINYHKQSASSRFRKIVSKIRGSRDGES